jgi:ligand-binding SRPBCC domain-containing protein
MNRIIVVETRIAAPRALVFDLARDVDAHTRSASFSRERAIASGRTSGLLALGDTVTFEGRHFGVRQRYTVRITEMSPPERFVDEAAHGIFKSLRHVHEFIDEGGATLMRDTLELESPLAFVVARYLRHFVAKKQRALKEMAEARSLRGRNLSDWR